MVEQRTVRQDHLGVVIAASLRKAGGRLVPGFFTMNKFISPRLMSECIANSISRFVDNWHGRMVWISLDEVLYDQFSWSMTFRYRYQSNIFEAFREEIGSRKTDEGLD